MGVQVVGRQITCLDSKLPAWALRAHTVYLSDNNVISLKGVAQVGLYVFLSHIFTHLCI